MQGQLLELERQYWLQLTDSKGFADGQVSAVKGWRYRVEGLESGYRSRAPATQGIAGEAKQAGQALVAQVLSALARRRSQPK